MFVCTHRSDLMHFSVLCLVPHLNTYSANIFVLKMLSAFNICCIYSNELQTSFDHGHNVDSKIFVLKDKFVALKICN